MRVETTDFTFNEDMADGPHVPGVGHAHLYLDGVKLQRLYHRDATIGALPPGSYLVRVTLNTNDHRVYMHKGAPISASPSQKDAHRPVLSANLRHSTARYYSSFPFKIIMRGAL